MDRMRRICYPLVAFVIVSALWAYADAERLSHADPELQQSAADRAFAQQVMASLEADPSASASAEDPTAQQCEAASHVGPAEAAQGMREPGGGDGQVDPGW